MPRRCSVCFHDERETIDELLLAKTSKLLIAKRFSLSRHAVGRHSSEHLHVQMARAAEKALAGRRPPPKQRLERAQNALDLAQGTNLLATMGKLVDDAERIKQRAEEPLDLRTALQGVRELTRLVELAGRLTGQLASSGGTQVNVGIAFNAEGKPTIPLDVVDSILDAGRERTGEDDLWGHFHAATADFVASDFQALWTWCRERRENRTRLLLEGHAPNDLPRDGAEAKPSAGEG